MIKLNLENCNIDKIYFEKSKQKVYDAFETLLNRNGQGKEFTGWLEYSYDENLEELKKIKEAAEKIRKTSEAVIVIGTGGSYLGTRSVITAIKGEDFNDFSSGDPKMFFAGTTLSEKSLLKFEKVIDTYDTSLIVISKSGSTIEPAVAFRILRKKMHSKYGKDASSRIFAITDKDKGALNKIACKESYEKFIVPDDIGGRYSVFTPVGLLPLACAGIDVDSLLEGLKEAQKTFLTDKSENNVCVKYALARRALAKVKDIEIFVTYAPELGYVSEWWKQLFGESEGKNGKGIFPTSLKYTTDLHSMGQLVQDGKKIFFETVLFVEDNDCNVCVPFENDDLDNLNYLEGRSVEYVNEMAFEATLKAHVDGNTPNILISMPKVDEFNIAKLYYFFMVSCGISAYASGVNPFDQPGVEEYKSNMNNLLSIY